MENSEIQMATNKLYGWQPKLEETWDDIQGGRLSRMRGKPPIVSKIHGRRGAYFVQDGHHRIMEDILNGIDLHSVMVNPDQPIMYWQAWESMLSQSIPFSEFLKGKS
jgi:hypothetical protein